MTRLILTLPILALTAFFAPLHKPLAPMPAIQTDASHTWPVTTEPDRAWFVEMVN